MSEPEIARIEFERDIRKELAEIKQETKELKRAQPQIG